MLITCQKKECWSDGQGSQSKLNESLGEAEGS